MGIEAFKIQHDLVAWLTVAGDKIRQRMTEQIQISTKSGRNDLVTNRDKEIEQFYVRQIRQNYPQAKIFGEEGFGDIVNDLSGLIFFVDPIDGTMNFVKQKQNFATMIGVYLDGEPIVGAILDVMGEQLIVGGPETGVTLNGRPLAPLADRPLADGLIGVNGGMFASNENQLQQLGRASSGVRITGSAGIEFIQLLTGQQIGYVSKLSPWDYAAGQAIGVALGIETHLSSGEQPTLMSRETIVTGLPDFWRYFKQLQS
ncbi:myo-inositol-1(or 4)-monophosphatase [Lapidilactobacillus concavus DSM 17758]|uniref:Myo-inositol-1(Or 4)-monophosphatase n=1 Tax=Lapidilactobacillus concavus DSM 17758 TaxID=1423735 RepID=A0A0R1VXE2_9LACO|nr:inositol monophosphatase family protein [Lapidilactobacillus concavus]KRM10231.1 myo-inositol-1(or 4)-monophosphatase [Lapidilactobacillus concavus DSM 17758]GEL13315.1 fructose 1,6-bisphosphatase [Lapidilactobacillus concavus]